VQQFFEAMGLSKPPVVQVSQPEVRFQCVYPQAVRGQVAVQTAAKKWVYASVESDSPWLKVLTPQVAGPQQAPISFEVDPRQMPGGQAVGTLKIIANAGQALQVRVGVEVKGAPRLAAKSFLQPLVTMAVACFLVRLLLVPAVDFRVRGSATAAAARAMTTKLGLPANADLTVDAAGGWLTLPWSRIILGTGTLSGKSFHSDATGQADAAEFREHFVKYFIRGIVGWTWWVGGLVGAWTLWRRGGVLDLPAGVIAGLVVGILAVATAACLILVVEIVPHMMGDVVLQSGGRAMVLVWAVLVVIYWIVLGGLVGFVLSLFAPLKRLIAVPVQNLMAGLCRICGLKGLANWCAAA
jgi:hypothetical protein